MEDSDYAAMGLDELIDLRVALKEKVNEAKAALRATNPVYHEKVNRTNVEARIKAAGLEGIVVYPDPATLAAEGR